MASEEHNGEERKKYHEIPIENPFIRHKYYWDRGNETLDKLKVSRWLSLFKLSHQLRQYRP
jgi:hypothetical protein